MRFTQSLLLLATSTLLLANPYESKDEEIASVIATGNAASKQLIQKLGSNLKAHLKSGGPIEAAAFCATEAYPLTDELNSKLGKAVNVKRISLKNRNPANAPQADEKVVLEALESLNNAGVMLPKMLIKAVDADTYKYYKPLRINKEVCLKCHGNIAKSEVGALIAKHYPEDKATGYKMGDLRGAIVVTIKK